MTSAIPTPVLSRSEHDRVAHLRTDAAWLEAAWQNPSTRVLVLSANARAAVDAASERLVFTPPAEVNVAGIRLLLGEHDSIAYFAVLADEDVSTEGWGGLREVAVGLSALDSGLMTASVAMRAWHRSHTHCPRCGAETVARQAGWSRVCVADDSQHFPRTDPAVIMLIDDGAERCLLGRSSLWPEGRFSTLAGFVEAGESAEAAVVREVGEEVGVAVTDVRYFSSQPHPFPGSLMLGFTASLLGDPTIKTDNDEIAEAGWFTRDEVRRAAEAPQTPWTDMTPGSAVGDADLPRLRALPPQMSIARQLIEHWLNGAT